jgi:hypothetical protein
MGSGLPLEMAGVIGHSLARVRPLGACATVDPSEPSKAECAFGEQDRCHRFAATHGSVWFHGCREASLYFQYAVTRAKVVWDARRGVRIVLPFAVHEEPVLVPSGFQPNLDFPASCLVPTETQVTRTPTVEIPGHEHCFGVWGFARQLGLKSPTVSSNICLVVVPANLRHRHGYTVIVCAFHNYSPLNWGLFITTRRRRLVVKFCMLPD